MDDFSRCKGCPEYEFCRDMDTIAPNWVSCEVYDEGDDEGDEEG